MVIRPCDWLRMQLVVHERRDARHEEGHHRCHHLRCHRRGRRHRCRSVRTACWRRFRRSTGGHRVPAAGHRHAAVARAAVGCCAAAASRWSAWARCPSRPFCRCIAPTPSCSRRVVCPSSCRASAQWLPPGVTASEPRSTERCAPQSDGTKSIRGSRRRHPRRVAPRGTPGRDAFVIGRHGTSTVRSRCAVAECWSIDSVGGQRCGSAVRGVWPFPRSWVRSVSKAS